MKKPITTLYLYLGVVVLIWIIAAIMLTTISFQDAGGLLVILPAIGLSIVLIAIGLIHYSKVKSKFINQNQLPQFSHSPTIFRWAGIILILWLALWLLAPYISNLFGF
ncbi:hypothetical protein KW782_00750 [Candidatus Parcubacteria bacterium]|nr:hypothetical protein [Candidatus Parcubacteria bacterium]